jgi:transcriptional regulator with XRE-family HTH domain
VGIGGALAEARTEAGLTVTQVSERTRIREKLIRDIERDDYSACGGDYYARGHIRAIARVVGTDPVPLIEEYDAAHMPPEPDEADRTDTHSWRLPGLHRLAYNDPGANGLAASSGPDHGLNGTTQAGNGVARNSVARNRYGSTSVPADTRVDTSADADTGTELYDAGALASGGTGASRGAGVLESAARWAESARSRLARPPEPAGSGVPGGITAAEAFRPSMPLEPRRRRRGGTRALALIVVAAIGTLVYLLAVGGSSPAPGNTANHHAAGSTSAKHPSAKTTAKPAVPGPLPVVSATAFGPGGAAQGDNPQLASLVLDRNDSFGWQTDWYGTAAFAGMQPGTGLLLNMGGPVTVTSAQIRLGPAAGGTIELRAGNTPSLRRLHIVGQAANAGGTLSVPVSSPVTARYLLIWFTSLPPDSTGTYQATIYHVRVLGTS